MGTTLWGVTGAALLAFATVSKANLILEDYTVAPAPLSISVNTAFTAVSANVSASNSRVGPKAGYSAFRVNGPQGTTGTLTAGGDLQITGSQGMNLQIGLGANAAGTSLNYGSSYSMNVNASSYNALVLKVSSVAGTTNLSTVIIRSDSSATSINYSLQPYITGTGEIILPLSSFTGVNASAVLADIDHIELDFTFSQTGSAELAIDSIELANVPEPATGLLAIAGISALLMRRSA